MARLLCLTLLACVLLVRSAEAESIDVPPRNVFVDVNELASGDYYYYYDETTKAPASGGGSSVGGSSGSSSCKCGMLKRSSRIVGGTAAEPNEYPYQVGLIVQNEGSRSTAMFCGATLISDRFILTAAHCTVDFQNSNGKVSSNEYSGYYLSVVLGAHNQKEMNSAKIVYASKLTNHPQYNAVTKENDIALIEIAPLNLASLDTGVLPACLPTDTANTYDGQSVTVTGWGNTASGGSQPDILQEVTISVISNADCANTYNTIVASMICAFTKDKDSCQGDSGGPLVHINNNQATLVGVVSFGAGCGSHPGVYARVTSYLSWITSVAGNLNTCAA